MVFVALRMLHPKKREYAEAERENIAIVPLAFPLTAGPGSITTVILLTSQAGTPLHAFLVFVGIAVGIFVLYLGSSHYSHCKTRLYLHAFNDGSENTC